MKKFGFKKLVIVLFILGLVCTSLVIFSKKEKTDINNKANMEVDVFFDGQDTPICIKAETIKRINEDFFDITFNFEEKTAVVDDKVVPLSELFDVDEAEVETIIASSNFEKFLKDNLTGDVEYKDGTIEISNPYSTNVLIVETEKPEIFNEDNSIVETIALTDELYYVRYDNAQSTKYGYEYLSTNDNVQSVAKDEKVSICEDDIETQIDGVTHAVDYAWGRKTCGLDTYTNYLNLKADSQNVYVAVLDTGIYSQHEVFKGQNTADRIDFTYSKNLLSEPYTTNVVDDNGHGTNVAGLVAECTPNTVKIVPLKIMDSTGNGLLSTVYKGIQEVYTNVDVINISLGSRVDQMSSQSRRDFDSFLRKVKEAGVVVCCAVGNSGTTPIEYPAASTHALGVASIDENKVRAEFSNYGSGVNYTMPGKDIEVPDYSGVDSYAIGSGTSYSTPLLAAAAALIKSENSGYTYDQVISTFDANLEDLGTSGLDNYYGKGLVNFNSSKFSNPVIVSANAINTTWKTYNTVNIKAVSSQKITNYAITKSNVTPSSSEWIAAGNTNTLVTSVNTDYNGTNYVWIKDSSGKITSQSVNVGFIDNTKPEITSNISLVNITKNTAELKVSAKDTQSGMGKVVWYVEKENGEQVTSIIQEASPVGSTSNVQFEQEFRGLTPNTTYVVYAYAYDVLENVISTNSYNITTLGDNFNVFLVSNVNTTEIIDFNANPQEIIAAKKIEFENRINSIKNTYLEQYNENIIFEEYDELFVCQENNYSYPDIEGYNLSVNYSTDNNGVQVKYYTLEYDNCTLKKEYDFSNINDVVMNYSDSATLLTKLKLYKDLFIISSENIDIAKVTIDNQNNVYVNTSEYAGNTKIVLTLPESSMYMMSTKTINVTVNPIDIRLISAQVEDKYKDGQTNATVTNVKFEGLLNGDSFVLGRDYSVLAFFENAEAGFNKKVYISVALNNTALAKRYSLQNTDLVASANIIDTTISVLKGDLDRNGVVDANDASVALELYKSQSSTLEDILIGDMDDNNLIDANDASLILEVYKTNN